MGWSPYYPAGVTDEMIAQYFGDDGSCCEKCAHYWHCDSSCRLKEDAITAEEEERMTEEEYNDAIHVETYDWCDNFEWDIDEPEYERDDF